MGFLLVFSEHVKYLFIFAMQNEAAQIILR